MIHIYLYIYIRIHNCVNREKENFENFMFFIFCVLFCKHFFCNCNCNLYIMHLIIVIYEVPDLDFYCF